MNAAMVLLQSYNQAVNDMKMKLEDIVKFTGPLQFIKKVDLSRPIFTLNHSDDVVLSNLPGQLHVSSAWPIFDTRFCQFELNDPKICRN